MCCLQKGLLQVLQVLHSDSIYALYTPLLYSIVRQYCQNIAEAIISSASLQVES